MLCLLRQHQHDYSFFVNAVKKKCKFSGLYDIDTHVGLAWVHFYFSCKHVICSKYNVCVVGQETVTEFLSEMHRRSCAAFNSTTLRSTYRDLLNVFKRCELCLWVSVWLTEMGLSTETQSWMGFWKYNIFTQCWWLHGFFFFFSSTKHFWGLAATCSVTWTGEVEVKFRCFFYFIYFFIFRCLDEKKQNKSFAPKLCTLKRYSYTSLMKVISHRKEKSHIERHHI